MYRKEARKVGVMTEVVEISACLHLRFQNQQPRVWPGKKSRPLRVLISCCSRNLKSLRNSMSKTFVKKGVFITAFDVRLNRWF